MDGWIENIKLSFTPSVPSTLLCLPAVTAIFDHFLRVTLDDLRDITKHLKPSTPPNDAIPPQIIKDAFETIGPSILVIINSCLVSGTVPLCFKHAVVQPLLKKHNLDVNCPKNYHPISKLPFISKILEKVVLSQVLPFLNSANVLVRLKRLSLTLKHATALKLPCLKCQMIYYLHKTQVRVPS